MKSPLLKSLLEMLKTYTDRPEYDNILGYAKDLGKHLNVPPSYLDWIIIYFYCVYLISWIKKVLDTVYLYSFNMFHKYC